MPAVVVPTLPPHGIVITGCMIPSHGSPAGPRPAKIARLLEFSEIGQAWMEDTGRSGAGRDRRFLLAAILALGLVIGGLAYVYSDDPTERAQSFTSGKSGHAQPRFHY